MDFQRFAPEDYGKLPHEPGVYKFFDDSNTIVYVGKAKDLNKRVSSYFNRSGQVNRKTIRLVQEIRWIEFVLVNSEFDALLLENNLIKENQPRYNILLKDDKSFPSICVTNERFPRVFSTRRIDPRQGHFFGPYTSVKAMNSVLELIRKLYTIRTCTLTLSKNNVQSGKYKVCLEYHIGNCRGPCEGLQTEEDYLQDIDSVTEILRGNISFVRQHFKRLMEQAAAELRFELAHGYKEKLEYLEKFQSRSLIVNPRISNLDVLGVITTEQKLFVNYMKVEHGSIIASETIEATIRLDEPLSEILQLIAFDLRKKYKSNNPEIVTNTEIESWEEVVFIIPKIGDKKKLIDLSLKNALFFKKEKSASTEASKNAHPKVLDMLQSDLNLPKPPLHIECFDNSNIQGTNPVASMVCFKKGKPSKKDYRKFNIKTVVGPDDFASMNEVVGRRYSHIKASEEPFPDLILIDGGKGQLNAACDALRSLGLYGTIPIVGIAKRLEELYFPEDPVPIHISKKSPSLKLLQHVRDEAHRFAVTFHRSKRSKQATKSELDEISGIGPKTKQLLIDHFKTVTRLKSATQEQITSVIGTTKAALLLAHFQQKRDQQ